MTDAPAHPSPEEVGVLLAGLARLLDAAEADGALDEALFEECQAELGRLQSIEALSEDQARTAMDLLYRWNTITQPFTRPPGLYPDPSGAYRKRYWDGTAWGAGVGRPRKA
ncbi:MAG: hypothetical protein NVS1B12_15500 [Acidimicrobiales bacterium]